MYDECCLGEADGWEELAACLDDYDQNWCIVGDSDEAWRAAVLANTPHLFSLGQDQEKVSKYYSNLQQKNVITGDGDGEGD